MHSESLQARIQKVVDDAVSEINALARQYLLDEIASIFDRKDTPVRPPKAQKATGGAVTKKARKPLSAQAKKNLRKNLEKAWAARKQKASERKAAAPKKEKATRKPARAKK